MLHHTCFLFGNFEWLTRKGSGLLTTIFHVYKGATLHLFGNRMVNPRGGGLTIFHVYKAQAPTLPYTCYTFLSCLGIVGFWELNGG
jgi:hypothetical protein